MIFLIVKSAEDARFAGLNDEVKQLWFENDLQSVYAEFEKDNPQLYCVLVGQNMLSITKKLGALEQRVLQYKDYAIGSEEYVLTKRNYLVTNLLLLMNFEKAQKDCNIDMQTIIYFYAEDKSCEVECGAIQAQLDEVQDYCKNIRIFAFPYNWQDYEFTKILEAKYDVNKAGTLIVNGKNFDSLQTNETLLRELECN
jgi:hypothetical protein